jgi:sn-glycerol 3-phosphate transport system permease protein
MKTEINHIRPSEWKWHILFIIVILIMLFPIAFAVSTSFKTMGEAFRVGANLIPSEPTDSAYQRVLNVIPFFSILMNTFIIAAIVTIFKLITGVLAAYSFVFLDFRGKKTLYFVLISTIFIPFTVTMIPNYISLSKLGLVDNILGVALPQLADATGIFLLRQHMKGVPMALLEVAKLENASHLNRLRTIVVPLIKPAILSIGIIFFINSWNEYVWPALMIKSKDNYTLPLALQMFVSSEGGTDIPVAMAVSTLTMLLPLALYMVCQKFIISTFAQSGIKG